MNTLPLLQGQLDAIAHGNLKIIECIPGGKLLWKPHDKSMTLGRLGQHLAELPHWIRRVLEADHYDFVRQGYKVPAPPASLQEIIDLYHAKYHDARAALAGAQGVDLDAEWQMRRNGTAFTKYPRAVALATQLSHMVHHRGQLSVYLRLLNVPIPGMYGPSADDRH
ncbi:MAG: hypothetical protein KBH07_10145 [Flavobacteriales bacterium]|nr:hypothetical protein [Flavobacteriales bacterium]MBP9079843.1 hypothetical protein [Flavobacteriales bacterium]